MSDDTDTTATGDDTTAPEDDTTTTGDGTTATEDGTTATEDDTTTTEDATTATERVESSPPDPDALFDRLVEADVLTVGEDGEVRTTDRFDDGHGVYYDSYVNVEDGEFHEAVAATFGLPDAEAAAQAVETQGITREGLARYLALRAELPDDTNGDDLAVMAEMVGEAVPDSPVPPAVSDVTEDPGSVLAGSRVVVTVWKRFCDPCEVLAENLDVILDAVPDDVSFVGLDGEVATEFCETYEVESAPAVVLVNGGESRTVEGADTDEILAALSEFF